MEALLQILSPDFLLRNSVYMSVLIGLSCPLAGVFLVMRRLVFMGVALPQISSTGVAVALSLPLWLGWSLPDHGAHMLAFTGSITFTLVAILVLALLERRGRGLPEGRLGTAYVVSAALSILLLAKNPYGETGWLDMMKGEVITISNFDLGITVGTLVLVIGVLGLFHKELLLVSFDREMALTLGKNVVFWDVLLYLLIGLTVSMAVLSAGPLIAFGFLLIPALTAHLGAQNMRRFGAMASLGGGAAALIGFWIAYRWDLPVGPTDVVLLGGIYGLAWTAAKLSRPGPRTAGSGLAVMLLAALLGLSSLVCAAGRFIDNGDGTVTDTQRNLMWQMDDNGKEVTFEKAQDYCAALRLGGYEDWRLPQAGERDTATIVKLMMPKHSREANARYDLYWSSDRSCLLPFNYNPASGREVFGAYPAKANDRAFVRAVRSVGSK